MKKNQCCRNEQMNINKQDKQTKHKPLFVRERSPTLVCPFNSSHEIFFLFSFFLIQNYLRKKQKKPSRRRNIQVRKSCQFALIWQAGRQWVQVNPRKSSKNKKPSSKHKDANIIEFYFFKFFFVSQTFFLELFVMFVCLFMFIYWG